MRKVLAWGCLVLLVHLQLASSCSNSRGHHHLRNDLRRRISRMRGTGRMKFRLKRTRLQGLIKDSMVCNDLKHFSYRGKVNYKKRSSCVMRLKIFNLKLCANCSCQLNEFSRPPFPPNLTFLFVTILNL